MRLSQLSRNAQRKGVEMVEFAMVLPLFFLLLWGIIEFGRAFEVKQQLTAAAREGARLAMLYNILKQRDVELEITNPNQKISVDVSNFMKAYGVNSVTVEIREVPNVVPDPDNPPDPPYNYIPYSAADPVIDLSQSASLSQKYMRVRVSVPYESVARISPMFLGGTTIVGEMVVRHE